MPAHRAHHIDKGSGMECLGGLPLVMSAMMENLRVNVYLIYFSPPV